MALTAAETVQRRRERRGEARLIRRDFEHSGGALALAASQQPDGVLLDPQCRDYIRAIHVHHDLGGPNCLMGSSLGDALEMADKFWGPEVKRTAHA